MRTALIDWITSLNATHSLTLNTDRELSLTRMKSIFGTFCHNVDRLIFDCENVKRMPSCQRFQAIAFPEHLETNAHLHVCADLSGLIPKFGTEDELNARLEKIWLKATRDAGSVHAVKITDRGAVRYAAKAANLHDPVFFLAAEFHPR